MSATALMKFTQGSVVGGDGVALLGVLTTPVVIHNVNNADVRSWQIDLCYVDPESGLDIAFPFAANDDDSTPTATFVPDVRCSYRWQLKVWNATGRVGTPTDVDIRCFSVPEQNGFIVAPPQLYPLPLPDTRTGLPGNKPNELNFDSYPEGWAGNGSTDGLLSALVRSVDMSRVAPYQVHSTTSSQVTLCQVDSAKWDRHAYVRAHFDVIVDNDLGSNFGYFNRFSIFNLNASGSLSHKATGEALFGNVLPAPVDGAVSMNTAHQLKVSVLSNRYIVLTGIPYGSTPTQLDLIWKVSAQFYFTKR